MRRPSRSLPALCSLVGALILAVSLFLPWSHQLTAGVRAHLPKPARYGVLADPSAFQLYAIAGEVLAVAALLCAAAGLWGRRPLWFAALLAAAIGLAFSAHALAVTPTNGLLIAPTGHAYLPDRARTGLGEILAVIGCGLALIGAGTGLLPRSRAGRVPA